MHKIITSDFEIDLSNYEISMQEENSWFSDTFFTKYSYPFDLIITDEINLALGDILSHDTKSGKYYLECQYVFFDKIENALLIIERIVSDTASVSLKYGMDEFPNFDKNLNELDLYKIATPNIYFHASICMLQGYPAVNHNFPQIHTDKYDPTTPEFNGFEKIINNRGANGFLENTVEIVEGEDVMFNRNIMQPMPYLMYILKRGFELSGLELKGDIVTDPLLQKILIFAEKEPFVLQETEPLVLEFTSEDVDENTPTYEVPHPWTGIPTKHYIITQSIVVDKPGKYNILGPVEATTNNFDYKAQLRIFKDNQVIYTKYDGIAIWSSLVDIDFILNSGTCEIKIEVWTAIRESHTVFDLQILPVYFIDENGKKETNLLNLNEVDLNKNVPDMTFGSFVTTILNTFNFDVDSITSDEIVINRITKSIKENEFIDLLQFENIDVEREKKSETSFLLKYEEEGDVDLGGFYIDKTESKFVTKEFTKQVENTISLNVFPLQNELIGDVFTAKSAQSSEDKLCFVIYDGLQDSKNTTVEPTALAIPNLVSEYHYEWLYNRVHCMGYKISFIAPIEEIIHLSTKKRAFCYNNIHLIKNISKNQLKNEMFEVEMETETLI